MSEKYLDICTAKTEEIKDKLQTTIEKEPDFIRIVETHTGEKFILQLEFQRTLLQRVIEEVKKGIVAYLYSDQTLKK